jgi:hypothetical protein
MDCTSALRTASNRPLHPNAAPLTALVATLFLASALMGVAALANSQAPRAQAASPGLAIPLPKPLDITGITYSRSGDKIACRAGGLPYMAVGAAGAERVGNIGLISVNERVFDFLTVDAEATEPAWRMDGKRIVFFRWNPRRKTAELYQVGPDGDDQALFKDGPAIPCDEDDTPGPPCVTADDACAVFWQYVPEERQRGTTRISMVNLSSGEMHALHTVGHNACQAAADPKHPKRIAYVTSAGTQESSAGSGNVPLVVVSDLSGRWYRVADRMSGARTHVDSLVWRPDGQALAYVVSVEGTAPEKGQRGRSEIRVWDARSGRRSVVFSVNDSHSLGDMAWAPGGERLACLWVTDWATRQARTWVRILRLPSVTRR